MQSYELINKKCEIEKSCGGCTLWDIPYEKQLKIKQRNVQELAKELKLNILVNPVIGMENPFYYRNKGKYAFKNGKMGFFEEGTHTIVYSKCLIQNKKINDTADYIFQIIKKYQISIYNEDTQKGFLRYIVIRYGIYTNEMMIIFVTTNGKLNKRNEIIKELITKYPNIKSIIQNINEKKTNAILGDKIYKLYGQEYITDSIIISQKNESKTLKFKISPLSFYQVNPIQMQQLYKTAIEYAQLNGDEIVYDLYSGIGTISLYASQRVKRIYGIEIVKEAVEYAKENAKLNNIHNATFLAGKVEELLPKLCTREKADIVFVDPPRSGLDGNTIRTLIKTKPKKIVYISCNAETLIKNLKELKEKYIAKEIQPVDMFPFTKHVECVTILTLK